MSLARNFDVAVVGAGVFGSWTALQLSRSGADVVLLDAYGPGNSRSSSGGESRIIRMGYGPDEIYTRMAQRSLPLWQAMFDEAGEPELFQPTTVLWLAREPDPYCEATLTIFEKCQVNFERLDISELRRRYPQLDPGPVSWGIIEPDSGVLMARRAVQAVVNQARANGVTYLEDSLLAPISDHGGLIEFLSTTSGQRVAANKFVFACGPWLPKLFAELLGELIQVTRQEVFFFGTPAGDHRFASEALPAWIDFNDLVYGIPSLDQRGFKIAIDDHGPAFDPDTGERIATTKGLAAVRAYLSRRLPALANAPVIETRVCQYENTSNGDFLIDRHPAFTNLWLVGGGSGHGFKHGPAIGEYMTTLISGGSKVEPRFSLATKASVQRRVVY